MKSLSSMPKNRSRQATRASPPIQMLSAANASENEASRNVPIRRPTTPKCAPLATGLFVPVRGPKSPMGVSSRPPTSEPTATALNAAHQLSPNAIGNQPMTKRLNVMQLPCRMKKRLTGRDLRWSSGMCSIPNRSTSNVRSSTSSGSLGSNSGPCGVSVDIWLPLSS